MMHKTIRHAMNLSMTLTLLHGPSTDHAVTVYIPLASSPHSALLVHHPPFVSFPVREQSVDQYVALTHHSGWRCRCYSGSPSQPIA